ncbi:hypothetical protein GEMRC1_009948 [Eukaryota sp. GEM-RC1]
MINLSNNGIKFDGLFANFNQFLRPIIDVDSHWIDFSTGTIFYDELADHDLISLEDALIFNFPIQKQLKTENIEELITTFKLLSLHKSNQL